jgi:hypothetical protein
MNTAIVILFYMVAAALLLLVSFENLSLVILAAIVLLGVLAADFFSGVLHMMLDYFPLPRDKRLAELYQLRLGGVTPEYMQLSSEVLPNLSFLQVHAFKAKIHHSFVDSMRHKTYVKTCMDGVAFAAIPLGISTALHFFGVHQYTIQLPLLVGAVLFLNAQFFHAFAHLTPQFGNRVLRLMKILQKLGIANSSRGHVLHHKQVDQKFCMITGWANVVVDPLFKLLINMGVLKRGDALLDSLLRSR